MEKLFQGIIFASMKQKEHYSLGHSNFSFSQLPMPQQYLSTIRLPNDY